MRDVWRPILLATVASAILLAAVLPAAAAPARPERAQPETVVRREEGGVAEALATVQKVAVSSDRAVITYRPAGEKHPRDLVVEYADMVSAILWTDDGSPLFWVALTLMGMGLALRLTRLSRIAEDQIPELAERRVPAADR